MHKVSFEKALQHFQGAYHLLNVTFPTVRDPKLLMGVIRNLSQSLEHAMDSILHHDRQLNLVPNFGSTYRAKLHTFQLKCQRRNKIPQEFTKLLFTLKEIEELQKKCPTEFQRGNRYVLCSKDYEMHVISIKDIKEYVEQTKQYLSHIQQIFKF